MKLHTSDAVALVEIWAGIKHYVPAKDQKQAAEQFISNIEDSGLIDIGATAQDLYGVCDIFDRALRAYTDENGLTHDDEDDDWDN